MRLKIATFFEKCKRTFHYFLVGFLPNVIFVKIAISAKSGMLKVACAIVATVLVVTSLFLVGFWVSWEIAGGVFVAFGCLGEWYLVTRSAQEKLDPNHGTLEKQCVMVVAIGVTMELVGLFHTIPETRRLEKDVAVATGLSKSNELQVVIARSNLARITEMGLGLKTNVEILGTAVTALSKLNDQSKRAIAEANARLAEPRRWIGLDFSDPSSSELRSFAGNAFGLITKEDDLDDVEQLGNDVWNGLSGGAKWERIPQSDVLHFSSLAAFLPQSMPGVIVWNPPTTRPPSRAPARDPSAAARRLVHELKKAGVIAAYRSFAMETNADLPSGTVGIWVGRRPTPGEAKVWDFKEKWNDPSTTDVERAKMKQDPLFKDLLEYGKW